MGLFAAIEGHKVHGVFYRDVSIHMLTMSQSFIFLALKVGKPRSLYYFLAFSLHVLGI